MGLTRIFKGAAAGACAWAALAAVDAAMVVIAPWLTQPAHLFLELNRGFTLTLIGLWAAAGAVMGALLAGVFPRRADREIQAMSTAASLAAYLILAIPHRDSGVVLLSLILGGVLLAGALASLLESMPVKAYGNPWVAAWSLLGTSALIWDVMRGGARWKTVLASIGLLALIAVLGIVWERRLSRQPIARQWVFSAAAVALIGGVTLLAQQKPLVRESVHAGAQAAGKPNVILVSLDTVQAGHLSVYGYDRDTSPNLKRFAQDAILYRNAYASGDMTLLTHASLFTGLYSLRHGAHYQRGLPMACAPLAGSHETLAEMLSRQGYDTAGIVANTAFLSDAFGMAQGFTFYDQRAASPTLGRITHEYSLRYFVREFLVRFSIPREYDQVTRRAEDVNAAVFSQLDRLKQGNRPFFLFVNYMDAHTPYVPPPPYDTKFPGKIEGYNAAHYDELTDKVMLHGMPVPEAERQHLLSQYDGGIAYLDEHLGKLFDRLRQLGLYDNSLIVVTSDHGEAFGERNQLEHWGISVYNNLVHVPWIVRYPASMGRERGIVKDEIVSSVDLMPTVLQVLGYPIPKQTEGVSLLAAHPEDRAVFSESYPRYSLTSVKKWRRIERAVVSGKWKLLSSTSGNCELYDLSADPGESHNVCSQEEKVSRELIGMVKKWVGKGEGGPATGPVTGMPDRGTMDSLKSLGYVQ